MTHRPLVSAAIAFALLTCPGAAQERPFPYVVGRQDALIAPAGVGLAVLGDRVANREAPLTRAQIAALTPDDVNGFDRTAAGNWSPDWGNRSDLARDALVAGAALVTLGPLVPRAVHGQWRDAAILGTMLGESYLLLRGATYTAKGLAGRTRPFVHNTALTVDERLALSEADPQDAYQSFYSGHSAAAFALATFMSRVFTDMRGRSTASDVLWASSLSVAGLTAYARVKAGMHYPSDVLVGAAVGTAIGLGVPWLHRADGGAAVDVSVGPGGVVVRLPR
ncbi:MAG TPA: phosphatase PAP2 family protein [Longimicrobiales bacterium]|nr:phosphatase PAP2 family protein [Longimicrobiales bacterium]